MPERISHYRITRKIGEGGMGVVYAAQDERLGRAVAIKTIRGANESPAARDRFWHEARSLARVNHPRICQIFEVDEEAGTLFLVLELLEGQSLEERLRAGPIPVEEALGIAREILDALEALHALKIVHRDLKPSNVYLTPHAVKLLDFGLARSAEMPPPGDAASTPTATYLTAPGMIVGTPHYMAPEQVNGLVAGPPADLFAAGCLLYEMLAGRRAFEGSSSIDVLYGVIHSEPPRLGGSTALLAIDAVIRRAIAKLPADRYGSAKEMAEALPAVAPATPPPEQPPEPTEPPPRRPVTRFIALPLRVLRRDDDTDFLAHSLPDAIGSSLAGIDSLIVRSTLMAARFEGHAADPKEIAAAADVDVILTGTLLRAGEQLRVTSQLVEAPGGAVLWSDTAQFSLADIFQLQDSLAKRIVESLAPALTDRERKAFRRDVPASARAYEHFLRANQLARHISVDNMKLARDLYLQCLDDDPKFAPAWARLGRAYRFIEKFGEESEENFRLADAAYQRAFALNADLSVAHNLYTSIEADLGRAQQAMVRLLERARFRRNDPELFAGLVQACRYCGELQASVAAHEEARRLDPHISTSVLHTYFVLGEYRKIVDSVRPGEGYYMDAAAEAALGRDREALARLQAREKVSSAGAGIHAMMRSLRALIEGDRPAALRAIDDVGSARMRDPESLFYMARHLVRADEHDRAIAMLSSDIDLCFLCEYSLLHDPWLVPLASHQGFEALMRQAAERQREAHAAFVAAGGEQILQ